MKKLPLFLLFAVSAVVIVGVVVLNQNKTAVVATKPETPTVIASTAKPTDDVALVQEPAPVEAVPVKYLPDSVTLKTAEAHPLLNSGSTIKVVNRPLKNLAKLIESDEEGGYLNPIYSPDGLQIMLTRAGYQGIYLVSSQGGTPQKISDDNAFFAKWTADSLIEVRNNDGEVRVYDVDGTLLTIGKYDPKKEIAYSDNDVVYLNSKDGSTPAAITDTNDRYIAPAAAPDGESVVYLGMYSGLYLANPKKNAEPIFLGAGGGNVEWSKKGDGFLYEDATDDGHAFVESDIYYYDVASGEKHNLTSEFDGIGLNPALNPDGSSVVFEVDGAIYHGVIP